MSVMWCNRCSLHIDTDFEAEHFDQDGECCLYHEDAEMSEPTSPDALAQANSRIAELQRQNATLLEALEIAVSIARNAMSQSAAN